MLPTIRFRTHGIVMPPTILLSLAASHLGKSISRSLITRGHVARTVVWNGHGETEVNAWGERHSVLTGPRADDVSDLFHGITTLILLSPTVDNQDDLVMPLIDEAARRGLARVVKVSTLGSHVEPGIAFGRRHRVIEKALIERDIPHVIVRSAVFVDNLERRWRVFMDEDTLALPIGSELVNWVDSRDVAEVIAEVATVDGHIGREYDVTSREPRSGHGVAELYPTSKGYPRRFIDITDDEAKVRLAATGLDPWYVNGVLEVFGITKRGITAMVSATVEHLLER